MIRFRIDGVLHEIARIPKEIHPAIVARIKLLSNLKIDEHNRPQDGRFRHEALGEGMDIRVSIMPTFYGEKVETRLLKASAKPMSLAELGMMEDVIKIIRSGEKSRNIIRDILQVSLGGIDEIVMNAGFKSWWHFVETYHPTYKRRTVKINNTK